MYQFITGIAFEITLIIIFGMGFLIMNGNIKVFMGGDDMQEWRSKNGRIIRMICLMTIVILICSIIAKYILFHAPEPPSLPT